MPKPSRTPPRWFKWFTATLAIAAVLLVSAEALAVSATQADAGYLRAMVSSYSGDQGFLNLRARSRNDPAFTADGLLSPNVREARCKAAVAGLRSFTARFLDAADFEGTPIHSHSTAAMLAGSIEAMAARNGCISQASLGAFIEHLAVLREQDVSIKSWHDLLFRVPMLANNGHWPIVTTPQSLTDFSWHLVLSDRNLRVMRCEGDPSCNPIALMKRWSAPADRGSHARS